MSANKEKLALVIDGANLYATAKSLGFDIDYTRLLREFQSRGDLLRAFFYTAVIRDHAEPLGRMWGFDDSHIVAWTKPPFGGHFSGELKE